MLKVSQHHENNLLVLDETHDLELADLLAEEYELYHF